MHNFYSGQEASVRMEYGEIEWFPVGKDIRQGCVLSPCLFNLISLSLQPELIIRKDGLDWDEGGMKTEGKNMNNLRYADDTTLLAENSKYLKDF